VGFNAHNGNLERPPPGMKGARSKIFSWILEPSTMKSEKEPMKGAESQSQVTITRTTSQVLIPCSIPFWILNSLKPISLLLCSVVENIF